MVVGQWVFIAVSIDASADIAYAFRYRLDANYGVTNYFTSKSAVGSYYSAYFTTKITWMGKSGYTCSCKQQFVRFFADYAATTNDQMINLALLNSKSEKPLCFYLPAYFFCTGALYLFNFESDLKFNLNRTIPVRYYTNITSEGSSTAVKGINYLRQLD